MAGRLTHIEIWLQRISSYNAEVIFLVDSSKDETFLNLNAIVESNQYEKVKIIKGNFGKILDTGLFRVILSVKSAKEA